MFYESSSKNIIPDQTKLWNDQHLLRGSQGAEFDILKDTPNSSAIVFTKYLNQNPSTILEIGCANGRDARYWASLGHNVICADFSPIALDQLNQIAEIQGVKNYLRPILHDIRTGKLPDVGDTPIHGFYSRSSLHIDDETMISVAQEINNKLASHGPILIEGKSDQDHKIKRSVPVNENLVVDHFENGHLRRVWTKNFLLKMCDTFKWQVQYLKEKRETYGRNAIRFLRLIARKS